MIVVFAALLWSVLYWYMLLTSSRDGSSIKDIESGLMAHRACAAQLNRLRSLALALKPPVAIVELFGRRLSRKFLCASFTKLLLIELFCSIEGRLTIERVFSAFLKGESPAMKVLPSGVLSFFS